MNHKERAQAFKKALKELMREHHVDEICLDVNNDGYRDVTTMSAWFEVPQSDVDYPDVFEVPLGTVIC